MRRGHPNNFGWRNDGPRQFRPRSGGPPSYRGPRHYMPPFNENPRFQHLRGPPPMMGHGPPPLLGPNMDRRPPAPPKNQQFLNRLIDERGNYNHPYRPHEDTYNQSRDGYLVNTHGDVDQRSLSFGDVDQRTLGDIDQRVMNRRDAPRRISPWTNDNQSDKLYDRQRRPPDYSGHRPPASDHYERTSGPVADESFSRSVDDTVDIIRKKLINRNDPQNQIQERDKQIHESRSVKESEPYMPSSSHHELKSRKKHRTKQSMKNNCDKIKNKIVHQLFKMDKERIHKLMDHPNSSGKFEYAINSLITESQNSLNRHLRSAAEKSLCEPRENQLYQNDTDAIYDDTFMKQMQCILDPQDTVILEDIKPFVLAELNKVLRLDEYDYRYDGHEDYGRSCHEYHNDDNYQENRGSHDDYYDYRTTVSPERGRSSFDDNHYSKQTEHHSSELFERRHRQSSDYSTETAEKPRSEAHDSRGRDRRDSGYRPKTPELFESKPNITFGSDNQNPNDPVSPEPFFNPNTEVMSEEEIFEELDRQYHVAVDTSFMKNDYTRSPSPMRGVRAKTPQPTIRPERCKTPRPTHHSTVTTNKREPNVRDISKLIPKPPITPEEIKQEVIVDSIDEKTKEIKNTVDSSKDTLPAQSDERVPINIEKSCDSSHNQEEVQKPDSSTSHEIIKVKSPSSLHSRKRSSDQKPSHRKEKRRKSDSSPNDRHATNHSTDDSNKPQMGDLKSQSCLNSVSSKDSDISKDSKKNKYESENTDKFLKKKESSRKKENESKKRTHSTSSSHSTIPKDNKETSMSSQTPTKSDSKTKLQTIDIFIEQPRKSNVHLPQRNTALPNTPQKKSSLTPAQLHSKKSDSTKSHTINNTAARGFRNQREKETQTNQSSSCTSRFVQTVRPKMTTRGSQTLPVEKDMSSKTKAKEPFERMKEIDMEIQVLLQEKFKLYNSLETKDVCSGPMQNLGMAVLSVNQQTDNEDAIVDNFTSIEDLEEIALESTPKSNKTQRRKSNLRNRSQSPGVKRKNNKTPNISLIEQIITDERPLEDIISLEDLETSPLKTRGRKRNQKQPAKSKTNNKPVIVYPETKPCSVVLLREDLTKYQMENKQDHTYSKDDGDNLPTMNIDKDIVDEIVKTVVEVVKETVEPMVIEEPVNEFHFDMLEVSEDIVIGEFDKVEKTAEVVEISEDIVLDNSQSGDDKPSEPPPEATPSTACKMYDYSADEDLKHDSVSVTGHADAVLAIECVDNSFLAACLDGNVYHFGNDGQLIATLRGSNLAVTCLTIVKEKYGTTVYTGSLDSRIRYYDLDTGLEKGPECNVLSPIQTMDRAWDTVFVGTRTGFVLQFECRNNMLIPISTVKFADQSILALRALKEGARKVLLIASRSENVTIKDAQTGLLLRTLDGPKMTVYTLLYEAGKVFCGTSSNMVQVFDYVSGSHIGEHEGGKGAVCLRAVGGVLFAGCYDGCVYVFRGGAARPLAQLRGPGVMLLSLAVHGGKMIAGYKDRSLYIWKIPQHILQEMIL